MEQPEPRGVSCALSIGRHNVSLGFQMRQEFKRVRECLVMAWPYNGMTRN
jgi:hypothetical protein